MAGAGGDVSATDEFGNAAVEGEFVVLVTMKFGKVFSVPGMLKGDPLVASAATWEGATDQNSQTKQARPDRWPCDNNNKARCIWMPAAPVSLTFIVALETQLARARPVSNGYPQHLLACTLITEVYGLVAPRSKALRPLNESSDLTTSHPGHPAHRDRPPNSPPLSTLRCATPLTDSRGYCLVRRALTSAAAQQELEQTRSRARPLPQSPP